MSSRTLSTSLQSSASTAFACGKSFPRLVIREYHTWRRRFWNPAVQRAAIGPVTPHELRHTAASLAIALGANPLTVPETARASAGNDHAERLWTLVPGTGFRPRGGHGEGAGRCYGGPTAARSHFDGSRFGVLVTSDLRFRSWAVTGSNRRPLPCRGSALPTELTARDAHSTWSGPMRKERGRTSLMAEIGGAGIGVGPGAGQQDSEVPGALGSSHAG